MLVRLLQKTRRKVLLTLLTSLMFGCSQAGRIVGPNETELPLPQSFKLHFNHRASSRYRDPLNGGWRNGDNLEKRLIQQIDSAREEVVSLHVQPTVNENLYKCPKFRSDNLFKHPFLVKTPS